MLHLRKESLSQAVCFIYRMCYTASNNKQSQPNLTKQVYDLHHTDDAASGDLVAFNDIKLFGLRPLAVRLFSAPASSAASERVFSQAGLIMRPTRNRLSKYRREQLVFLKCNMKI